MSEAMDKGREMHEAVNWAAFEKHVEARQAEDRIHRKPIQPTIVYIDMENQDGHIRALIEGKQKLLDNIIVISKPTPEEDAELKKLILGTHPMQQKRKAPLFKMPTEFVQERMNVPWKKSTEPEECNCEFTPYDDTEPSTHYKRTCLFCGGTWFGLHCPHDGHQRPCPNCGKKPVPIQ